MKSLLAKASSPRSGDQLAGIAAETAEENVASKLVLADVPFLVVLAELLIPCVYDEVTPRPFAGRPCSRERNDCRAAILLSDGRGRKSKVSRFF